MKNSKKGKAKLAAKMAAYAATAVSALAVAHPASAAIQYSGPQNLSLNNVNSLRNIDLNNDGTTDFHFTNTSRTNGFWQGLKSNNSNQFLQSSGYGPGTGNPGYGHTDAAFLPQNYQIAGVPANTFIHWSTGSEPVAGTYNGYTGSSGSFNNRTGFIGVRFHSAQCQAANWNYGWIRFTNIDVQDSTIVDWAYESTCNTPIAAGDTTAAAPEAVPTLDEWGMLALAGLLSGAAVLRMKKKAKA